MRRPPQACFGHTASNTAVAGQPDGDLAEQRGDRVLTIILDPAGRATATARRTARGVPPRLRSDELLLDASQELFTLGQAQAQGGQVREVVRSGDPHDLRAAFGARGPDAYQLHDPGHAVSASPINEPESTLLDLHPQSRGGPVRIWRANVPTFARTAYVSTPHNSDV